MPHPLLQTLNKCHIHFCRPLMPHLDINASHLKMSSREIAEPLFDLKLGMEQLAGNRTFKKILATLLAVGNFLNGSEAGGFELAYLEKVAEVKDTVHRQTLLHHVCALVTESEPRSSDVYSEIPAVTRSAKVDFELLADNLLQLERRCKASWENLQVVSKHETKSALKNKMADFLKDCTQRILILKVVHRRVINRFHSFLLFLGQPAASARDTKVTGFCRIISEFALEYRTTREALTLKRKRDKHRERTKTRGKLITETEKFSGALPRPEGSAPVSPEAKHRTMTRSMTRMLTQDDGNRRRSHAVGASRGQSPSPRDHRDRSDDIMERLVELVTRDPEARASAPKTRKRSRINRKSTSIPRGTGWSPVWDALYFWTRHHVHCFGQNTLIRPNVSLPSSLLAAAAVRGRLPSPTSRRPSPLPSV
ncbi:FH1/FH2 domain-containing protein 3-like isoform X3 [Stigmatopora nigra]